MLVPLGDSPNPRGFRPWVTYGLVAANALVFLVLWPLAWRPADPSDPAFAEYVVALARDHGLPRSQWPALGAELARSTSDYDLVVFGAGFRPAAPSLGSVFSAMFLHGGLAHLLGNLLFLWIYGDNVEHRLGRLAYLTAYLATGAAATAGDGLLRWGSGIPSVGASGAISGVLGLYFTWFPHNRVQLMALVPFGLVFELPARLVLGFYLVVGNLLPWLMAGGDAGVSHGAHIGGFAAGWLLGVGLDRYRLARAEPDLRVSRPSIVPPSAELGREFRTAVDEGRLGDAAELLARAPRGVARDALDPGDKLRLGDALAASGHPRAALAAYQRVLADHPAHPLRASAHLRAARVLMHALGMPTAAYQHVYAALESDPSREDEVLARETLGELNARSSLPRRFA
jgi:membrane associated rhomboid family serine protease